jgi:hypothetical protein
LSSFKNELKFLDISASISPNFLMAFTNAVMLSDILDGTCNLLITPFIVLIEAGTEFIVVVSIFDNSYMPLANDSSC